jgi:hypothetical protein
LLADSPVVVVDDGVGQLPLKTDDNGLWGSRRLLDPDRVGERREPILLQHVDDVASVLLDLSEAFRFSGIHCRSFFLKLTSQAQRPGP